MTGLLEGFKVCFTRVLSFVFLSVFAILVGRLIGKSDRHFCFKYCLMIYLIMGDIYLIMGDIYLIMGTKNWNLNLFTFNINRRIYVFRKLKSILVE